MLKLLHLSKSFHRGTEHAIQLFKNFNLEIQENGCTAIIGANGCGKSTLLNIIGGSLPMDDGKILLRGRDLSHAREEERSKYMGRVYQDPSMGTSPSLTILENMALADKRGERFTLKKLIKKDRIKRYRDLLMELDLGLEGKLNTRVRYLSGGQRQALSLLMATMKQPELLLLDEHTAALDPRTSHVIMKKTRELTQKNNITTIMVSHNMKDAIDYSDRVIMLDQGKIILDRPSRQLTENDLIQIYRSKYILGIKNSA